MLLLIELHKYDHETLKAVATEGGATTVNRIMKLTGLAHAAVMKAVLRLEMNEFIQVLEEKQTLVILNEEGRMYAEVGLPERRLINSLTKLGGEASIKQVAEDAEVDDELIPIALGWLRRKGWALIKGSNLKALGEPKTGDDEKVLAILTKEPKTAVEELGNQVEAVATLRRRTLLETREQVTRTLKLSEKGRVFIEKNPVFDVVDEVSQLTSNLIITGKWREVNLRKFDVIAPSKPVYPGKIHPLQQIIDQAREIFFEMGFTEIRGPLIETAFWNFDALFQPQDHPAREMQDTFYLYSPKTGKLPEKKVVDAVCQTHENGWTTGSKGWGYTWSHNEAKKLVLRTHTTAETIKYLSKHKRPPIKVFSVDRVYRNEQLTSKNAAEFFQIEGIVADKGVTFRDLMGTLKEFYSRLGLKTVQFWPSYFPYTEPSAQAMVYVSKLHRWMELCGMGMFRPEVLAPMGIEYPVLAWGGGLERIAMLQLEVNDIRSLFENKLNWIRRTPLFR